VAKQSSECVTLTSSKVFGCSDAGSNSLTKILLITLVVVLGIGILGVGGYFGYEKYKDSQDVLVFQRVPADEDDEAATTPLGSPVEEDSS